MKRCEICQRILLLQVQLEKETSTDIQNLADSDGTVTHRAEPAFISQSHSHPHPALSQPKQADS